MFAFFGRQKTIDSWIDSWKEFVERACQPFQNKQRNEQRSHTKPPEKIEDGKQKYN